jgi:hypothetical protein
MFGRNKPPAVPKRSGDTPKQSGHPWHAVDVVPGRWACPAVTQLGGRRFLASDAPRLPLPECSSAWRCQCVYRHFDDRRTGARRASERDGLVKTWFGAERRTGGGRRSDDRADH